MGIGGALAEARTEAGLTITQVSERTRIRETIIRGIERDDYSACGGDYYARGHIRAIARVVGTDPVPLIEEYDAARMPPEPAEGGPADLGHEDGHGWRMPGWHRIASNAPGGNGVAGNSAARNRSGRTGFGSAAQAGPEADTSPELYDPATPGSGMPEPGTPDSGITNTGSASPAIGAAVLESAARWAGTARSRLARPAEPPGGGVPGGITAAEAFRPSMPLEPARPLPKRTGAIALIVLAAIGTLAYLLVSGGSSPGSSSARHHSAGTASARHPSAGGTPKAPASSPAPGPLTPLTAAAFGPGGIAQGDDPLQASLVLGGSSSAAWQTDWYSTASFGGLQSGTGLLLDMGKRVSVTSAQIRLGTAAGGALQLRAGNAPSLARLHIVAQARNPGGTLTLPVSSPVRARYLLIWFTALPPDSSGSYQASIYNVSLSGTS